MEILGLRSEESRYEAITESIVLPPLTSDVLARFVEEDLTMRRPTWVRAVREWAQDQEIPQPGDG